MKPCSLDEFQEKFPTINSALLLIFGSRKGPDPFLTKNPFEVFVSAIFEARLSEPEEWKSATCLEVRAITKLELSEEQLFYYFARTIDPYYITYKTETQILSKSVEQINSFLKKSKSEISKEKDAFLKAYLKDNF